MKGFLDMSSESNERNSALLVDVGGVLLLLNAPALTPVIARHGGVSTPEEFSRAHCAAHNAAYPSHDGPAPNYYDVLPGYAGVPEDRQAACVAEYRQACRARNMWDLPDPASKSALARFAGAGIKIAVVSQADGHVAEMLIKAKMCQEGPGPGVRIDRVFDSAIVGLGKPDPRFFLHAAQEIGVDPDRAVHVGDTVPADVRGAESAGIMAVHYDPYDVCDAPQDHRHVRRLIEMSRFLDGPGAGR